MKKLSPFLSTELVTFSFANYAVDKMKTNVFVFHLHETPSRLALCMYYKNYIMILSECPESEENLTFYHHTETERKYHLPVMYRHCWNCYIF